MCPCACFHPPALFSRPLVATRTDAVIDLKSFQSHFPLCFFRPPFIMCGQIFSNLAIGDCTLSSAVPDACCLWVGTCTVTHFSRPRRGGDVRYPRTGDQYIYGIFSSLSVTPLLDTSVIGQKDLSFLDYPVQSLAMFH